MEQRSNPRRFKSCTLIVGCAHKRRYSKGSNRDISLGGYVACRERVVAVPKCSFLQRFPLVWGVGVVYNIIVGKRIPIKILR